MVFENCSPGGRRSRWDALQLIVGFPRSLNGGLFAAAISQVSDEFDVYFFVTRFLRLKCPKGLDQTPNNLLTQPLTLQLRLDLAVPAEFDDETGTNRLARPKRSDFIKDFMAISNGNTLVFTFFF